MSLPKKSPGLAYLKNHYLCSTLIFSLLVHCRLISPYSLPSLVHFTLLIPWLILVIFNFTQIVLQVSLQTGKKRPSIHLQPCTKNTVNLKKIPPQISSKADHWATIFKRIYRPCTGSNIYFCHRLHKSAYLKPTKTNILSKSQQQNIKFDSSVVYLSLSTITSPSN